MLVLLRVRAATHSDRPRGRVFCWFALPDRSGPAARAEFEVLPIGRRRRTPRVPPAGRRSKPARGCRGFSRDRSGGQGQIVLKSNATMPVGRRRRQRVHPMRRRRGLPARASAPGHSALRACVGAARTGPFDRVNRLEQPAGKPCRRHADPAGRVAERLACAVGPLRLPRALAGNRRSMTRGVSSSMSALLHRRHATADPDGAGSSRPCRQRRCRSVSEDRSADRGCPP